MLHDAGGICCELNYALSIIAGVGFSVANRAVDAVMGPRQTEAERS